jgi:Ran GTPase-activating protein (RanGAP) involved in mRNA processing and transport
LFIGWNLIRLDGAVTLCSSLSFNQSLTHLELSFNSLGSNGGIALGDALQDNKTLKTLYISNNSLDSIACLTICAGIFQNEALETISFNENPIGEQGAKVLMVSHLLFLYSATSHPVCILFSAFLFFLLFFSSVIANHYW